MALFFQRNGIRVARNVFRWCRMTLWIVILLVISPLARLYLVGLPEFLKPPLLQKIRERGFDARFASARLGWGPAIIIENGGFSPTNRSSGPRLSAGLMEVKLNWIALLHRHLKADSVEVRDGQVRIPVSERYGGTLALQKVHLRMRLFSNDVAQVTDFGAWFRGIGIRIDGQVTNFASMSDWKMPAQWEAAPPQQAKLGKPGPAANILDQLQFGQNPRVEIYFSADGRDINTLRAEASFTTSSVETPWAGATTVQLRGAAAHLLDFTNRPFMQVRAAAESISTRYGTASNASVTAAFFPDPSTPFNTTLNFAATDVDGKWNPLEATNLIRARRLSWDGEAALSPANFKPLALEGILRVVGVDSSWGSAGALSVTLKAARTNEPAPPDANRGIWTRFSPFLGSCHFAATNIQNPRLRFQSLALDASWRAPNLAITNLGGRLYQGGLEGGADLDIDSRELRLHASTDFDPHGISQVLTPAAQLWLAEFEWQKPPAVNAQIRLVLPPWTNRPEAWRNDLRSSVEIAGGFSVGAASFRKVNVASATARVFYTNRVWTVPRLYASRRGGSIDVDYTGNDDTREFHVLFDSRLDPADVLPLLEPRQRHMLDDIQFSRPPEIRAEASGHWHMLEATTVAGTVLATNFTYRGVAVDRFGAGINYTNRLLRVSGLEISQGKGRLEIPLACGDFESKRVILTNARSTLDPQILLLVMGTDAPEFLNFIHFDVPPEVRANGTFVLGDPLATDMRFEVLGGNFHWTNLGADTISANVRWNARNVALTNVQAQLYNSGKLSGWLVFENPPGRRAGFRGDFIAKDIDLGSLSRGLEGKNSRVEGRLDGSLALEAPVSDDKNTWMGHGYVHIHNGLLWDIKILGVLSPMLNAISPGLGDSRARDATAIFAIGGGKVSTDDLEIHSTGVRLLYRGAITMNKQINGRVEADLLRDTPLLGTILSVVMTPLGKLFEYQITGPLRQPSFKPLYIPKFLMLVLRPFHTVKSLLPEDKPNPPPNPVK
jgi:hypothetical protein